ncbi:MAG: hypothetical protein ABS84_17430 [Rubrivivax sp. SCN 71-131]|nr:MAG: hypothetical protein ABS84_17430 [Rubrivivax sp. SCN 71-131]
MLLPAPALRSTPALAQLRSGETIYKAVFAACRDSGVAHAPKFGDARAWKPLIEEDQHVLSAHAFVGARADCAVAAGTRTLSRPGPCGSLP